MGSGLESLTTCNSVCPSGVGQGSTQDNPPTPSSLVGLGCGSAAPQSGGVSLLQQTGHRTWGDLQHARFGLGVVLSDRPSGLAFGSLTVLSKASSCKMGTQRGCPKTLDARILSG